MDDKEGQDDKEVKLKSAAKACVMLLLMLRTYSTNFANIRELIATIRECVTNVCEQFANVHNGLFTNLIIPCTSFGIAKGTYV